MIKINKFPLKKVNIEQSAILRKNDMRSILGGYLCWCCGFLGGGCNMDPIPWDGYSSLSGYCDWGYIDCSI